MDDLLDRFRQRFEERVVRRDGCWGWTGPRDSDGYARFKVRPKTYRANRVSWLLHRGPIPDGLWVLHRCDNPICTNPDHLYLGTGRENAADREARGRGNPERGEKRYNAKLTEATARSILADYVPGVTTQKDLARRHGVSQSLVSVLLAGRVWRHVDAPRTKHSRAASCARGERSPHAKLTEDQVREIRRRYAEGGISQQKLADEYGVRQTLISGIVLRQTWKHVL